jgi:mannose-1-phosphate guanylyltransferase
VKAVVLVGGEGTRLRPLTLSLPKQMLPVVERPMIERVLAHLGSYGVDEAVLSLQYLPKAFIDAYPDGVAAGVRLQYATEPSPLDTAGAIRFAAAAAGIDETFVVVNGDVLTDLDLSTLLAFHRSHDAEGTLRLYPVDDPSRFGVVDIDGDGRVRAFIEKPPANEAPTNLINAGTYVFEPSFLDRVPAGERVSIERVTFPAMVADGQLFALADDSYWIDTGTPAAFIRANLDLLDGRRPGPPVAGVHRAPDGSWRDGESVVDGECAEASFVGAGVRVDAGAAAHRSVLGAGSALRESARVRDSVLLPGVLVDRGAVIREAIIGSGARIGAECEVRPGSVIGFGAELAPHTVVEGRMPA